MNLSELQDKEVIDISTGKRVGAIIDVIIDRKGGISKLLLEDRKPTKRLFAQSKDNIDLTWNQIIKIGDDIILVDCNHTLD